MQVTVNCKCFTLGRNNGNISGAELMGMGRKEERGQFAQSHLTNTADMPVVVMKLMLLLKM